MKLSEWVMRFHINHKRWPSLTEAARAFPLNDSLITLSQLEGATEIYIFPHGETLPKDGKSGRSKR